MGYNYMDPQAEAYHKAHPDNPGDGHGDGERSGHARHLRDRSGERICGLVRPVHHDGPCFRRRLVAFLQRAAVDVRRLRVDRVRLSRRAFAEPVAEHQLAVRRHRHLRLSRRTRSSTTSRGGPIKPVLHLFPHWNWPGMEGQEIAVWVHSNLDKVELFLNGQSLGAKEMQKDSHLAWNVKYAPGSLRRAAIRGPR